MRNLSAIAFFLLAVSLAPTLKAQDQVPRFELSASYNYVRFNINANVNGQPPSQTFNGNGGGGELVFDVNRWLGVVGDTGGYWAVSTTNSSTSGAAIPYLAGPRVTLRRGVFLPFVHVLAGGVVTSSGIQTIGWQSHFAMAAGGGLDIKVSKHLAIRPAQAEYFMTRIPNGLNNRENNFRFGAGVVFRFG